MQQQNYYQEEIIDYALVHRAKYPIVAKICGWIASFFTGLLILIIGIIIGAVGVLVLINFI
jgi:hypothetical protein